MLIFCFPAGYSRLSLLFRMKSVMVKQATESSARNAIKNHIAKWNETTAGCRVLPAMPSDCPKACISMAFAIQKNSI